MSVVAVCSFYVSFCIPFNITFEASVYFLSTKLQLDLCSLVDFLEHILYWNSKENDCKNVDTAYTHITNNTNIF